MRSRGVRVATAVLALSGAGLMVTGVANAGTAPALAPGKVVDGPLDVGVTDGATDPAAVPTVDPATDPAGDPTTDPAATATADPAGPGTATADPTTKAPGAGTASAGTTATAGAGGDGDGGGDGMTQAPAKQSLAETGGDDSVPFLAAGGIALLAGGLVFRFGPRSAAAPRHGA